ncbi:hypothetical protein MBLNU457_5173t1 [Dothideomycetes sp. NU457]
MLFAQPLNHSHTEIDRPRGKFSKRTASCKFRARRRLEGTQGGKARSPLSSWNSEGNRAAAGPGQPRAAVRRAIRPPRRGREGERTAGRASGQTGRAVPLARSGLRPRPPGDGFRPSRDATPTDGKGRRATEAPPGPEGQRPPGTDPTRRRRAYSGSMTAGVGSPGHPCGGAAGTREDRREGRDGRERAAARPALESGSPTAGPVATEGEAPGAPGRTAVTDVHRAPIAPECRAYGRSDRIDRSVVEERTAPETMYGGLTPHNTHNRGALTWL